MNALVVGYGRMGGFHRKVLRDLGLDVTTVDPRPAAGADHTVIPHRHFAVVCVAAPIEHLAEVAADWAGRARWLLVEKPAAASAAEAIALADTLVDDDVAVGYVERFNPQARRLRARTAGEAIHHGKFIRWNDRPSPDPSLDLQSHDIDLAQWLGVRSPRLDARCGMPITRRQITLHVDDETITADLMDHDVSPLHAQWHAFLTGSQDIARMDDAIQVLTTLERTPALAAAA